MSPADRDDWDWVRDGGSPYDARFSPLVEADLRQVLAEHRPDVVVVGPLDMAPYLPVLRDGAPVLVLDADSSARSSLTEMASRDAHRGRALLWRLAAERIAVVEQQACSVADAIWATSAGEATTFQRHYADSAPVRVIPNVVDVSTYPRTQRPGNPELLFPARFDYWPNEQAAHLLVDDVLPALPSATLTLVGLAPTPWMVDLRQSNVVVTGPVDDVRPFLAGAGVMPVPLVAGSGTRLKVLEAFASGVPVVSTDKGVEGLELVAGEHYLRAEDAGGFIEAIQQLARDVDTATALAQAGRSVVVDRFSVEALSTEMRREMERLLGDGALDR